MSIEKWYIIKCDGCGRREDPCDESEITIRECLKIQRETGWKHENATAISDARDLCPDCVPKPPPKPIDPRQQDLF